jgi:hypothetical protein
MGESCGNILQFNTRRESMPEALGSSPSTKKKKKSHVVLVLKPAYTIVYKTVISSNLL